MLKRRVGSISIRGVTTPEELETIQEEDEEECEQDGLVVRVENDDSQFEGFYESGVPHGYFRILNSFGDLEFFGCFFRGLMLGVCWKSLPGGGFLISKSLDFSDSNMIYLYPDCRTGLIGSFRKCELESGKQCELNNFVTLVNNSIPVPLVSPSSSNTSLFTFDPATSATFSRTPHLADPYEDIFVEVRTSKITDAGQGLFAKIDIDVGTIISFYNGIKVRSDHEFERPTPYKMLLDDDHDIDIPDTMTTLDNYSATLGHKVCHSFQPNCETDVFHHPRFGLIRCIATLRNIMAGQEILINYG